MKFNVTRTSYWAGEDPVCPGEKKERVPKNGRLKETYTVEINTMEELLQLVKKVGNPIIVFKESGWGFELPELEIYDGYRE